MKLLRLAGICLLACILTCCGTPQWTYDDVDTALSGEIRYIIHAAGTIDGFAGSNSRIGQYHPEQRRQSIGSRHYHSKGSGKLLR